MREVRRLGRRARALLNDAMADASALVGVLGGSFNPPHIGHLIIASEACDQLGLDRVLFVPAVRPPHKEVADDVPAEVRLELARRAIGRDARFAVSTVEVEAGLSYTVDALTELHRLRPEDELVFVMGSDSLLQFASWHRPADIVALAHLAVALRPGDDPGRVAAEAVRWGSERVTLLDSPLVAVSSSDVRERVRQGRSIAYLVPDAVAELISAERLYSVPR